MRKTKEHREQTIKDLKKVVELSTSLKTAIADAAKAALEGNATKEQLQLLVNGAVAYADDNIARTKRMLKDEQELYDKPWLDLHRARRVPI